jgi:hypothetical protein
MEQTWLDGHLASLDAAMTQSGTAWGDALRHN